MKLQFKIKFNEFNAQALVIAIDTLFYIDNLRAQKRYKLMHKHKQMVMNLVLVY